MKHYFSRLVLSFLLGAFLMTGAAHAAVVKGGDAVTLDDVAHDDVLLTGETITVDKAVDGEVFAIGQNITTQSTPSRSMFLIGNTLKVQKGSGYNAFVIGQTVRLSGAFNHDVYVIADNLVLDPDVTIAGSLMAISTTTTLAGTITKDVALAGVTVKSSAVIGGDLHGRMPNLTFEGGSIGGNLRYDANVDATGLDKVAVKGSSTRVDLPKAKVSDWIIRLFATILFVFFVIILLPRRSREMYQSFKTNYIVNLAIGALVLILAPLVALLFLATIVGWKVAALVLCLYGALILVSSAYTALVVGEVALQTVALPRSGLAHSLLVGVIGVLIMSALSALPVLGGAVLMLIGTFITTAVLGALVRSTIREQQ